MSRPDARPWTRTWLSSPVRHSSCISTRPIYPNKTHAMPFKLSASLRAHKSDVRAVLAPSPNHIVSASRDSTAISWLRASVGDTFAPSITYHAGERYVNALAWVPPSKDAPEGLVVTGGQEAIINLFPPSSSEPSFSLLGHEANVCALHVAPDGTIISGSWDATARVWRDYQEVYTLKGHTQAVWAVLALGNDQYLTGSADRNIILWQGRKPAHTYKGHNDAVRGLVAMEGLGFASCSNDAEIRVWSLDGECLQTLSGHTSFVYALAVTPSGLLISSSEDRSARVWRDGECIQTIVHPAISVWSVAAMPNGDFVTGASDGVVRVFSEMSERWASEEELKTYDASVQSQALPSQQVGDVKKTDLPGPEALNRPGNKEGQVIMIRQGGTVEAHQWSSASGSWEKVGEVVDAVGSSRKQLFNGKEYDYVFDVDVQEGVPPLKLPYNVNENPYAAAQRFLAQNDLPPSYLDQVVQFIEKNTSGVNIGSNDQYQDPFTGAGRYRPGSPAPARAGNNYADPFTGAGAYRSSNAEPAPTASSQLVDPFTGSSAYSTAPAPRPAGILPVRTPLTFKQANVAAVRTKVQQLNDTVKNSAGSSTLQISSEENKALARVFDYLAASPISGSLPQTDPSLLLDVVSRWPEGSRFPLVDVLRLICAHAPASISPPSAFVTRLLDAVQWDEQVAGNKSRETNCMLALRAIANLEGKDGGAETWERLRAVNYVLLGKTQRVALATITLNASSELLRSKSTATVSILLQLITTVTIPRLVGTRADPAHRS
ncbi:phospholipase A-2-activating protein [Calocera viscosa TUFC12733]|uniref:Phospholipase A-2-activating protein n=1 Tax=Calocera viscosa (strain TUFC12733) TaxID=1330018 RepID=A0A167RQ32_CALVF|nr:phospholipase A-2-activating protein [Calocera viscosa TUFC12733]